MTQLATFREGSVEGRESSRLGIALSTLLHFVVVSLILVAFHRSGAIEIIAAGPGEGGEGGGGSIEVGVAEASAILGFAKPQPVSMAGDEDNPINNARLETVRPQPDDAEEVLPDSEGESPKPDTIKTDRPVVNQQERLFTGKEERGGSSSQSIQLGRSFGSPTPAMMSGGIGIGSGGGFGGTGLPGGSEYGRRIQTILSRYYAPPVVESDGVQYVVILLRIARDGTILSVANGRVAPSYIKQRSPIAIVNNAAERAVLAANPLPPFPAGFLSGTQEAVAEVWFRYPK
jgi:hypothetical protein